MSVFFYNIFLLLYRFSAQLLSTWNPKAKKWIEGRKGILDRLKLTFRNGRATTSPPIIWIHCSSLGEFEQARPVIERIRTQLKSCRILLTFFSPSGYEVKKNYAEVDHVFYLPFDSKRNAKEFIDIINPILVIFTKYDFWYYYLAEVKRKNINCILISAVFKQNNIFFRWYGALARKMLRCFTEIFVQDPESKQLLESIGIKNCQVSGDTRFDAVDETARNFKAIPIIEEFIGSKKCIVAGSTWQGDEEMLRTVFDKLMEYDLKLIIAPHEVHGQHIQELKGLFSGAMLFSELISTPRPSDVLIVDNIGMLSQLYHYSYIAYIGGGFTRDGVHNVLEAAVYGKPVVFGKNFAKYREAIELLGFEAAKSFSSVDELYMILTTLLLDEGDYRQRCNAAKQYIYAKKGATEKIMNYIAEKRLLTSW